MRKITAAMPTARKPTKYLPISLRAKAWTDCTIPERAENTQEEGGAHQHDVPDLHHAFLLLHHYGVQKRRAAQPREQGSVLHRIPSPVAAPAEHVIRPRRTQHHAGALE